MITNKTAKEIIDSLIEITETMQKSALIPEIFKNQIALWCIKHDFDFDKIDKTKIRIEENKDVCCLPTRAFDFFYIFLYFKLKMFTVFLNHPLFENFIIIREYPEYYESEINILIKG